MVGNRKRCNSLVSTLPVFILAALFFVATKSEAQSLTPAHPLFSDETPLTLRISGPFQLLGDDPNDRPEYDALLEHVGLDGTVSEFEIEFRIRGRSRLNHCHNPPLSIDFSRDAVGGSVFAGQNRLKLVTLCRESANYRDFLIHEFLIYRMLNELTNRSFRVRWATVEYIYTGTSRPRSRIEPAFLIEGDWEVAERLGLETIDIEQIKVDELDAQYAALTAVFHFMIGNTDWAVVLGRLGDLCCHNGKVIGREGQPLLVLPYDFDNAGLVSARYAYPNEILPIRSVRQRLYRGHCVTNEQLGAAILHINQRRERLIELLDDESLSARARRRGLEYFVDGLAVIDDPNERQEQIYAHCIE